MRNMRMAVLVSVLASLLLFVALPASAEMQGWQYQREITIQENSGETLRAYQVLVALSGSDFPEEAQADGDDIRFTDVDGASLNYWIEEFDEGSKRARIWIKVPLIPVNGEVGIMMWYGNPGVENESDGEAVFEFFDDFESYTVGDIDGQDAWLRQTSYGLCEVSTTIAKEKKSLRVYDDTSSGYPWVTKNIQPHTTSFVIEFDYYPYAFSPHYLGGHPAGVGEDTKPTNYAPFHIHWGHDLGLYYFNTGSQWTPIASNVFTKGAWNKITYKIIDFQNLDIYVANKYIGRAHETGAATKVSYVTFGSTGTSPAGDEYYIDNIRIRKYSTPEPTVTLTPPTPAIHTALSITKSPSPHSIRQFQETVITIAIENSGTTDATDIEITDAIHPSFDLTSGDFPNPKRYDLIRPGETRDFQYTISAKESGTFTLDPATVTYADKDGNIQEVKSEPASIKVITSTEGDTAGTPHNPSVSTASVQLHGEKTDVVLGEDILLKLSAVNLITKPTMHVQVIIIPPSGMSVTSSAFARSGAGQYTTTYELEPGSGKDIEVAIRSNQVGDFEVNGRIIYYFGDDRDDAEDHTLTLPITVRAEAKNGQVVGTSESNGSSTPGFVAVVSIIGLFLAYLRKRA